MTFAPIDLVQAHRAAANMAVRRALACLRMRDLTEDMTAAERFSADFLRRAGMPEADAARFILIDCRARRRPLCA